MHKELSFNAEARDAILCGVEKLAKAVVSTLGPQGRCAVLDKSWGGPVITKDGVTVARDIDLEYKAENLGAQLVKEAATKTNDRAGDGTTTSTLLAWMIYKEALRHLAVGESPNDIISGLRQATRQVVAHITKQAKPIKSNKDIKSVATIASTGKKKRDMTKFSFDGKEYPKNRYIHKVVKNFSDENTGISLDEFSAKVPRSTDFRKDLWVTLAEAKEVEERDRKRHYSNPDEVIELEDETICITSGQSQEGTLLRIELFKNNGIKTE